MQKTRAKNSHAWAPLSALCRVTGKKGLYKFPEKTIFLKTDLHNLRLLSWHNPFYVKISN
jgi:hypothetical protein